MTTIQAPQRPLKANTATRLLIVDDSALMRKLLVEVFSAEKDFELCTARHGKDALEQLDRFQPDVVTLDINMPEMDGLTALSLIMAKRPTAVVMVSSLTEKGAMATLEALALGAVDFIPKPDGTISLSIDRIQSDLVEKVRSAARARVKGRVTRVGMQERRGATERPDDSPPVSKPVRSVVAPTMPIVPHGQHSKWRPHGVVVIGVSTGGPRALEAILPKLPADYPWPVLVSQHMPSKFTETFARRLDSICALDVVEVNQAMPLVAGRVYLGQGGTDMVVSEKVGKLMVQPTPEDTSQLWHPSVEVMVRSVHRYFLPEQCVGVMLTGMGYDGAEAMAKLKLAGGRTIAESEETAVVFGMPAELIRRDGASLVMPLEKIAAQIQYWTNNKG